MVGYIPDESSIAAFRERVSGMITEICAEEFVAKPSFMGCQRCDYRDLCEVGERDEGVVPGVFLSLTETGVIPRLSIPVS